jgi:hypothetical protein
MHSTTTTILPKLIHLVTQWYILYPLIAVGLFYLIRNRNKKKKG